MLAESIVPSVSLWEGVEHADPEQAAGRTAVPGEDYFSVFKTIKLWLNSASTKIWWDKKSSLLAIQIKLLMDFLHPEKCKIMYEYKVFLKLIWSISST